MSRWVWTLLFWPFCALAADLPAPWVQATVTGWEARSVVAAGGSCPVVLANGVVVANAVRAAAGPNYPITVCAAVLPDKTTRLTVGGVSVPPPPARVNRIVIVGDTGCRLKGELIQDCNDTAAWPWERVSREAAAQHPDLVIHVGDYEYRETPCPANNPGCAASPAGDNWEVWRLDVMAPAASLLAAAPWIVVRGNHEMCDRGGNGWFRLLDPNAYAGCVDYTPPYRAKVPGMKLLVMDTAVSNDRRLDLKQAAVYREQFKSAVVGLPKGTWLVDHHPIWAVSEGARVPKGSTTSPTLQKAFEGLMPDTIDAVVSGHIHDFVAYDFGGVRPAQLVVGNGGDAIDGISEQPGADTLIDGLAPKRSFITTAFGFVVLDRDGAGWNGVVHGLDGAIMARCKLAGRSLGCR